MAVLKYWGTISMPWNLQLCMIAATPVVPKPVPSVNGARLPRGRAARPLFQNQGDLGLAKRAKEKAVRKPE
uniref:Uncharacterized protein n=1 Tax=Candidatus Kentrum sp. TC TaxID=2126339 RepID=A0A450Z7L5_9GAMM|nr:MAG: hypothetical protein BECKTC1821D_GA0114238_10839 [Candidatus Kentron sp. TC]